jgi:hypothetical protein
LVVEGVTLKPSALALEVGVTALESSVVPSFFFQNVRILKLIKTGAMTSNFFPKP